MSDIAFIQYTFTAKQDVKHKFNTYQKEFNASEKASRITESIDTFFTLAIALTFIVSTLFIPEIANWLDDDWGLGDFAEVIVIFVLILASLLTSGSLHGL